MSSAFSLVIGQLYPLQQVCPSAFSLVIGQLSDHRFLPFTKSVQKYIEKCFKRLFNGILSRFFLLMGLFFPVVFVLYYSNIGGNINCIIMGLYPV